MVKVERLSENRVKLVVTVSAEQFDLALDAAFNKVVKEIKVCSMWGTKVNLMPMCIAS